MKEFDKFLYKNVKDLYWSFIANGSASDSNEKLLTYCFRSLNTSKFQIRSTSVPNLPILWPH